MNTFLASLISVGVGVALFFGGYQIGCNRTPEPVATRIVAPDGKVIVTDASNKVAISGTFANSDKSKTLDKREGTAQAGTTSGTDIKGKTTAPVLNLNDETAQGSYMEYAAKYVVKSAWLLYIIGAGLIGLGIFLAFTGIGLPISIMCWVAGGAMIFMASMAEYAAWAIGLGGLLIVGVIVYAIYHAWKSKQATAATNTALGAVVSGVEATPDNANIKANIATAAGAEYQKVKDVISKLKTDLGI